MKRPLLLTGAALLAAAFPAAAPGAAAEFEKNDWWDFHVENRGSGECHIALGMDIDDRSGRVVKSGDRSDTVNDHELDGTIRISTRMRPLDIADSTQARVRARIGPR